MAQQSDRKRNVAVVGATGAVGEVVLRLLAERRFPVGELRALASGTTVPAAARPIRTKRKSSESGRYGSRDTSTSPVFRWIDHSRPVCASIAIPWPSLSNGTTESCSSTGLDAGAFRTSSSFP